MRWAWGLLAGLVLAAAPPETGGEARLKADVLHLATAFHPRSFSQPKNLEQASAWIANRFREAGAVVTFQTYTVNGDGYRNVLARFGPEQGPRIVLGAHYDAVRVTPGADDNASGVAVLLEVARLFGKSTPAVAVELAAYANEEPPCFRTMGMGSAQHAQRLKREGAEVRAMVSVDMVGDYSQSTSPTGAFAAVGANTLAVVGDDPHRKEVLDLVAALAPGLKPQTKVISVIGPRSTAGIDWSDHHPFWDAKFPGVMVTDGAWNRNKAYHSPEDRPERLDYPRMAELAQALRHWILQQK